MAETRNGFFPGAKVIAKVLPVSRWNRSLPFFSKLFFPSLVFCLSVFTSASICRADLVFDVQFSAQSNNLLSESEKQRYRDGVQFWDDIIIGHQDGVSRTWTLTIDVFSQERNNDGSILLGSAGPNSIVSSNVVAGAATSNGRYWLASTALARFNVHADAGGVSDSTIRHEIGHALGIGALWELNEVYDATGAPGEYTGAFALAAYRNEFVGQAGAAFIPVELSGGSGTAHGHWDESDDFGATATGIVDHQGRDLREELMTGYASNFGPEFLSNTSRESLRDIGFTIVPAVPEPASLPVMILASLFLSARIRRKKA